MAEDPTEVAGVTATPKIVGVGMGEQGERPPQGEQDTKAPQEAPQLQKLQLPAGLLAPDSEAGDDLWSWGLSPRVVPIVTGSVSKGPSKVKLMSRDSIIEVEEEDGYVHYFLMLQPFFTFDKGCGEGSSEIHSYHSSLPCYPPDLPLLIP